MRKFFTSAMICAIGASAFAQTPVQPNNLPEMSPRFLRDIQLEQEQKENQPKMGKKANEAISEYFRFVDDWSQFAGGFGSNFFFAIFPDTFVTNVSYDADNNRSSTSSPAWCGVGAAFDPNDVAWSRPLPLTHTWQNFEVDSIFFTYGYFRKTNSDVVDTLIIQVYNGIQRGNAGQIVPLTYQNGGGIVATINIDRDAASLGRNFSGTTIKIPINEMDSTIVMESGGFTPKNFGVDISSAMRSLNVGTDEAMAVSITYKPGTEYVEGDTLFFADQLKDIGIPEPVKKLNRFGILIGNQVNTNTPLTSYNNGMFVPRWHRYENNPNSGEALRERWIPNRFGNRTTSYAYYPYIAFKLNSATSIEAPELDGTNTAISEVFPNPASGNQNMSLKFSVTEEERVEIVVYDLTGKKVKTLVNGSYNKGVHQVNFNSAELGAGMYIYTFNTNKLTTSGKFHIID